MRLISAFLSYLLIVLPVFVMPRSIKAQSKNLGKPYSHCQRASDLGFDVTGGTDDTTKLHDFINGVLTVNGFANGCLYADGIVRADGQITDAGWAALGGTITLQGDGATSFNSSPGPTVLRGFNLKYTSGPKIIATWSGALVTNSVNIFSSAGNSDCASYVRAYLTSVQNMFSAYVGGPTNNVGCQTAIEYGTGGSGSPANAYDGYTQFSLHTKYLGLCSIAKLQASADAANAVLHVGDYYQGGDANTPTNCQVFHADSGTSSALRILQGTYEGWAPGSHVQSINAILKVNAGATDILLDGNGFYDFIGTTYVVDSTAGNPTNVRLTGNNFYDTGAASHLWNSWSFGNGNVLPEWAMIATTSSYNPGSINAGACGTTTVGVAYATAGYPVVVDATTRTAGFFFDAYVSANGTVTVRVCNASGSNGAPTASTYKVHVIQATN